MVFALIWYEFAFEIESNVMRCIKVPILQCTWNWLTNMTHSKTLLNLSDVYNIIFVFTWIDANERVVHVTGAEIKFVAMYLPRNVVWNFIIFLYRKSPVRKAVWILHQSLTCARADNAKQQKETNKNSRSWYPITLAQFTRGLGKLVYSEFVRENG